MKKSDSLDLLKNELDTIINNLDIEIKSLIKRHSEKVSVKHINLNITVPELEVAVCQAGVILKNSDQSKKLLNIKDATRPVHFEAHKTWQ